MDGNISTPFSLHSSPSMDYDIENLDGLTTTITSTIEAETYNNSSTSSGFVLVHSPIKSLFIALTLSFMIVATIVGNILVCVAVCLVRRLRRPCNYLIVSLAVSDLCVAILVMSVAMVYELRGNWPFGKIWCDVWVSFDVLCCTASILNLCMISVDRYYAIIRPLEYGVRRTPKLMLLYIAGVWGLAALISVPAPLIIGNDYGKPEGSDEFQCLVCQNSGYQIYATLLSFYIPSIVMLFVYYKIFRAARKIMVEEKKSQVHLRNDEQNRQRDQQVPQQQRNALSRQSLAVPGQTCGHISPSSASVTPLKEAENEEFSTLIHPRDISGSICAFHNSPADKAYSPFNFQNDIASKALKARASKRFLKNSGIISKNKLKFFIAKERKASTTLGIIMSAFTICWLPFFVLALIRPFLHTEIPPSIISSFLWLGYANSMLNPVIYATLNKEFRTPFREILCLRCKSLKLMMREEFYQYQYGESDCNVPRRRRDGSASQVEPLGAVSECENAKETFL